MAKRKNQPELTRMPKRAADGRYHYWWYQDGQKRHVAGATQQSCIAAFFKKAADIENGLVDVNPNTPVNVWAKNWISTYKETKGLTPKSLGMYREKLNGYILPAIGGKPLKMITELHLQQIINRSAGMSKSHLSKLRLVMREMFGKAYQLGYIKRDIASALELPAASQGERRSLTDLEQKAFDRILAEGKHRGCLFYGLMYHCGLRPGECAALLWRHVDFQNRKISIEQAKESGSATVKDPKTESGVRVVPIPDEFYEMLRAQQGFPAAHVFTQAGGNPHTDSSLYAMWKSCKRLMNRYMTFDLVEQARGSGDINRAAVILSQLEPEEGKSPVNPLELARRALADDYRKPEQLVTYRNKLILFAEPKQLQDSLVAYDLRHTCCTNWLKAGLDLKTVSYLMGHRDITTTANIYAHMDLELVDGAAEKINAFRRSKRGNVCDTVCDTKEVVRG